MLTTLQFLLDLASDSRDEGTWRPTQRLALGQRVHLLPGFVISFEPLALPPLPTFPPIKPRFSGLQQDKIHS